MTSAAARRIFPIPASERAVNPDSADRLFRLDGAVAVVTGGASGIGCATATLFAAAGAHVVVADCDAAGAEAAASEIAGSGGRASAVAVDVAEEASVEALCDEAMRRAGAIDVLVNNAGTVRRQPAVELPLADWQHVLAVNTTGAFLCARAAARRMIAAGRGGAIVNTASIMGLSGGGVAPNIAYQASKGAVVNMTRALAVEWAPHRIRVNSVAPTYVRTPFIAALLAQPEKVAAIEAMTPLGRLAEPQEVAAAILFLAAPAAAMITGHTLAVDGGFLAQ